MLYNGDERKIKAFERLVELGVFIPLTKEKLYHGRANTTGEEWRVLSNFNNGGNATGNRNLNKIPALNVAEEDIAKEFAQERALDYYNAQPEVHQIASTDPYAVCVDLTKIELLNSPEVKGLISILTHPSVSQSAVKVPFSDKEIFERVSDELEQRHLFSSFVPEAEISIFVDNLGYDKKEEKIARDIAKAVNSHMYLAQSLSWALKLYTSNNLSLKTDNGSVYEMSAEYFASFFAENHIVGLVQRIYSATLDKEIDAYQLFDLKKINTEKEIGTRLRQAIDIYRPASKLIGGGIKEKSTRQMLTNTPESIIKSVTEKSPRIKEQFEGDVGLWEGFNLGEHTETVMRFFAQNFADVLPIETRAVMNLVILCHDIGKAECVKLGIKRNSAEEREIYKKYARILGEDLGVQPKLCDFVMDFVFESQKWTTEYYIKDNDDALSLLKKICEQLLDKYGQRTNKEIVNGLMQMARVLQTCDSGAYTLYAKTRKWDTVRYYHNGNADWTKGFVETELGYRFKKDVTNSNTKNQEVRL